MSLDEALAALAQKDAQIDELVNALESANGNIAKLQHQLELYVKRLYGPKSEKYDPNQLFFDLLLLQSGNLPDSPSEPESEPEPEPAPPAKPRGKRTPHGRLPIPDHLERHEIILDIDEDQKTCPVTGEPLVLMRYEESEKLEFWPGRLHVNVYKRPVYGSPDRSKGWEVGVLCAPMPDHPIAKCKGDIGLISQIIVSKFCDHLPLYRQDSIFEREDVRIPRSTQGGWLMQTYEAIRLLGEELKRVILASEVIFTDDSVIPLLEKGRGSTRQARLWVYIRGDPAPKLVIYDFTVDRKKCRPIEFLGDYGGYVHADAYSGYDELFGADGVTEVGCWAHARRKFDEAKTSRPLEGTEMLSRIAQLYQVETLCRDMEPEDRHAVRAERSAPLLDALFERLKQLHPTTLPSEPLSTATGYALNQEHALRRYLDDGRLEVDNNTAENAIRPLALGRKNWLFAGSERGGKAAALYLSLVQSCKACGVNPWEYFNDVLRRIMSHPANQLRGLLPDRWKPLPKDQHGLIVRRGV